jgi:Flp pilus assembly protein TadD
MNTMHASPEVEGETANLTTAFQARIDQALGQDPPDPEAIHQLGLDVGGAGEAALALELLSRAVEIDSSKASYFISIGRLLASETMFNQAALAYLRAQELAADDPVVLTELAGVLGQLHREEDALAVLRHRDELAR